MKREEIITIVNQAVEAKLKDVKGELANFRRWQPIDSATDQFSPITGASMRIGFFGTSKQSKQTVSGSASSIAALTSLLTALETYGLITDSSS